MTPLQSITDSQLNQSTPITPNSNYSTKHTHSTPLLEKMSIDTPPRRKKETPPVNFVLFDEKPGKPKPKKGTKSKNCS